MSPGALPSRGLVFQLVCHFHRYWAYSSNSTVWPKMESCFQDGACPVCFLLHSPLLMLLTHSMSIIHRDILHSDSLTSNLGEWHQPLGYKVHNTLQNKGSTKQNSILGRTLDFELYAQYLWKQHTNWKTRPPPPTPDPQLHHGRAPGLVPRLSAV